MTQVTATLCVFALGVAQGQTTNKIHRRYPRTSQEEASVSSDQDSSSRITLKGRWEPPVQEALEKLLNSQGKDTPGYSAFSPPVAVFTLEDVAMGHDVGEAVFRRLVDKAEFKFDRAFWLLLPVHHGSERIRAGYTGFHGQPTAIWPRDPYYRMYRKAFFRCYQAICRDEGVEACRRWMASLLVGFTQSDLRKYVRQAIEEALDEPLGEEIIGDYTEDPDPVAVRKGIRKIAEMEELIRKLRERGFDVWIMSLSNQWAAEAFAELYGVDSSRVIGVKPRVTGEKVTKDIMNPIPYRMGQLEALQILVGSRPMLTVGGAEDNILLSRVEGLRVCISGSSKMCPGSERLIQKQFKY